MTYRPSSKLVWFGVAGGAGAWALQFVAGLAFSFAQCNQPAGRWHVSVRAWQVGLAAGGLVVALASLAAAVWVFLRTFRVDDVFSQERRGDGAAPPIGRVNFLAMIGITVNALAIAIILMDGVGTALHSLCQQS